MSAPLLPTLAAALAAKGYETLTPVQEAVTDPAYDGADLLVSAQTGSGKTVGFGLAIAPTLLDADGKFDTARNPLALVIAPTRELALQVRRELTWLYAEAGVVTASCVGGMDMRDERRVLDRGAHVVVATPGRLVDHIKRGTIDLSDIRAVVLDEADEMLDLGFREDLEFILGEAPDDRRTLMFSATVPKAIADLARSYQRDAVRVQVQAATSQHADIEYRALTVSQQDAENAIINVLQFYDAPNAIVFANTRAVVNRLTTRLSNRGFHVVALSGELTQTERTHALQAMRDGRARVCVATDVAARGIDLPNLDLVVHAELPSNHEILLHRSGRTGRAGRKGVSCLIVPPKVARRGERILKEARLTAEWAYAPSAEEVSQRDEERLMSDAMWTDATGESEAEFAARLRDNFTPDQLALAVLRQHRAAKSAPEDLMKPGEKPVAREKTDFGPSVWFLMNVGRNNQAEARWILPKLCDAGGITKDAIGAIRIQPDVTYVQIREGDVTGFLAHLGPDMRLDKDLVLTRLAEAPTLAPKGRPARPDTRKPREPRREYPRDDAPREAPPPSLAADEPAILPRPKPAARKDDAPKSFDRPKPYAKPAARDGEKAERPKKVWTEDRPKKPNVRPRAAEVDPHEGARTSYKPKAEGKPYAKRDGDKPYAKRDGDKPYVKRDGDKPYVKRDGDKPFKKRDGDKPYAKRDGDKPKSAGFKSHGGGKSDSPKKSWGAKSHGDKPAGKPGPRASDTSKRFTPPKRK